jgi:hypothetical protein
MTIKRFKVRSRTDPNVVYNVIAGYTFSECDCPAGQFRRKCAHQKFILEKYYGQSKSKPNSDAEIS